MTMADGEIRRPRDRAAPSSRAGARQAGGSLEAELRPFLSEAARARRQCFVARLDALNQRLRATYGELPDSTPTIRHIRGLLG
jgi:hypothetical protein